MIKKARILIQKARILTLVFLNALLKEIRLGWIREKSFLGKYVDIEIERRKWVNEKKVIITGEKTLKNAGGRKVHHQIVFYVPGNFISKWMGYTKLKIHYRLAGWV